MRKYSYSTRERLPTWPFPCDQGRDLDGVIHSCPPTIGFATRYANCDKITIIGTSLRGLRSYCPKCFPVNPIKAAETITRRNIAKHHFTEPEPVFTDPDLD